MIHKNPSISILMAALYGDIKAVKEAIAAGADVNVKGDKTGWTPLHNAASEGHKEIAELLIAEGADVNAKHDVFRMTPLHSADTKEIAELIIAEGADVNAKDGGGFTPLDEANRFGSSKELADLLRKHCGKTGEELKAEGK
jgi:ankyrin repeat protein